MRTLILPISVFSLITSMTAYAHNPLPDLVQGGNEWTVTFYDDSSEVHLEHGMLLPIPIPPENRQTLCFFRLGDIGTQSRGIWFSTTFHDWNGRWRQEGDQVFMTGDFGGDRGHDSMEWEHIATTRMGAGHWREWLENGGFGRDIGYGNAKFVRTGRDCNFLVGEDIDSATLEKAILEQSLQVPMPVCENGKELLGPADDCQLPLAEDKEQ